MSEVQLLVIAKAPVPGRTKTRLGPAFGPEEAARLAEAALTDTLQAVAATPAARRVLVLDGEPGPWLPPGFDVLPQRGNGLASRLGAAFADAGAPSLLIGMDTPQVTPDLLADCASALCRPGIDAVLGEAHDGGWWAIGMRQAWPEVFEQVPMSTPTTSSHQRLRLAALGMRWTELPPLRDVDTPEDAYAVADLAPDTRFAAVLAQMGGS